MQEAKKNNTKKTTFKYRKVLDLSNLRRYKRSYERRHDTTTHI